jgi:hypothetical protein
VLETRPTIIRPKTEILKPEPIPAGEATLSSRGISWMVDHWQKNKPSEGFFSKGITEQTENLGGDDEETIFLKEEDLPIVEEIIEKSKKNREEGKLINKAENPLGDNVTDLTLMLYGDAHIPGSDMKESIYELNNPYKFFKKIRELFLGLVKPEYQYLTPEEVAKEVRDADAIATFNAFMAIRKSFQRYARRRVDLEEAGFPKKENSEKEDSEKELFFTDKSKIIIANIGDIGDTEQKMGDLAYAVGQLDDMYQEIADISGVDTTMMYSSGNHDDDQNNHGLEQAAFHRKLLGSQVYSQDIGKNTVLLSLNTNFYDTFWHQHLERRKIALHDKIIRAGKRASGQGRTQEIIDLEKEYLLEKKALADIRAEMLVQKKIINEALESGKKMVVVGHEYKYLKQAMGGDFTKINVIATASGHGHIQQHNKEENTHGDNIDHLVVGTNKKVKDGNKKKSVLSGFALRVRESEDGEVKVGVDEIIPTEADYQEALYDMGA